MAFNGAHYEYQPSFILGFHGCDKAVAEKVLGQAGTHLKPSEKDYDWLGHGIYFWEGNVARAFEWAQARKDAGAIDEPAVVGAIIDLRHCLDLFDLDSMNQVRQAHKFLVDAAELSGFELPKNAGKTPDKAARKLDCLVLNTLHGLRAGQKLPAYDSVRGPFLEGEQIYQDSGFRSHTHIQICVRQINCIKGYFRPISAD